MPNHPLFLGGVEVLAETPGQFFSLRTCQIEAKKDYWAYRDDAINLMFWKGYAPYSGFLRMVPMSLIGTKNLRELLAGEGWKEVAELPTDFIASNLSATHGAVSNVDIYSKFDIEIDFENLPSSSYYWETFFHIPMMIATQLSKGQRFEEAQRWFHLIFDPTNNEATIESKRYWRFKPFRENKAQRVSIEQMLTDLAQGKLDLSDEINAWVKKPFRPHLIARHRYRAYQITVVLKYLENLIAWADQLFRRDTIESINEATQLYVLAARILGKRPASSPKNKVNPKSYRDIQSRLDDFSNAWIPFESLLVPHGSNGTVGGVKTGAPGIDTLNSLGTLYFCVPHNEKLSEYWDTVEDRLFKIRHCMNIEGIERQLPLFEPPIDPALLVRATAAGLDLASVLAGMDAPLPLYRFSATIQKAAELCGEVKALGSALLSALEKKDAEQLSRLRSAHEIQMLKFMREIKEQQKKEAEISLEALRKTRESVSERYLHYQRLMGKDSIVVPAEGESATLESSTLQLSPSDSGDSDTQGLALISSETDHLRWMSMGNNYSIVAGILNTAAAIGHALPNTTFNALVQSTTWGGSNLGHAYNAVGSLFSTLATNANFQANRSSTLGSYQRRYDEWQFQSNSAAKELQQIDKQIAAGEIRKQIAERELSNHDQQIENAQEVDDFMRAKFTSQELYSWMVGQISRVYFRTYQLAYDMCKRTEACYRREIGLKDSNFIQFGYWDSLKKGLMAGESLHHDLKRLEVAYLDQNKREYEITKHVSLAQFNPTALLGLKTTKDKMCNVSLPEALFDLDYPGHYMRRIKSVSVTIPCVTGPYASVDCTLTLLKSSIRYKSMLRGGKYVRDEENEDSRFSDSYGEIQSIVTSSGQNDSGMFETNLRDERYLPFEGAGVISDWRIELPSKFPQFDYDTISDVILHIRYTAREGGKLLRETVSAELQSSFAEMMQLVKNSGGLWRMLSLRHDFPNDFNRLLNPAGSPQTVEVEIRSEHFPYLVAEYARKKKLNVAAATVYLKPRTDKSITTNGLLLKIKDKVVDATAWKAFDGSAIQTARLADLTGDPTGVWAIDSSNNGLKKEEIDDILILFNYTIS